MDYKKLYEEALERAKKAGVVLQIFPDAQKAEDERIKERIAELISDCDNAQEMLDWLENHRKQSVATLEPIKKDGEVIGVNIPVINRSLLFADVSKKELKWEDTMEHAKKLGKELPKKDELYILQFFREEIAKYFPRFKNLDIWSQTESQSSSDAAWAVNDRGAVTNHLKYYGLPAVPLADLITSD